jgi:hypothetical protein
VHEQTINQILIADENNDQLKSFNLSPRKNILGDRVFNGRLNGSKASVLLVKTTRHNKGKLRKTKLFES